MAAYAELVGHFSASTNYIWRGVTQTDDNPALSAALEYHIKYGSYAGLWASNIDYDERPSYEVNAYIGHRFDLAQVSIDLAARYYYFPSGGKYNYDFEPEKWESQESSAFTEFHAGVTYKGVNVAYAFSNNYLDSGYTGYYVELNYTYEIIEDLSLKLHIGAQTSRAIDDTPEHSVGDHSLTLRWKGIYATASNMMDNEDGRQSDRIRYLLGWDVTIRE